MTQPIAIVGMACLFPGASSLAEFWQNLVAGRDSTSLATMEQMGIDPLLLFDPAKGQRDRYYALRGGFVQSPPFDPTGYQLPPEQLAELDKLYAWTLRVTREALADGGVFGDREALTRCGLVLGNLSFPTHASQRLLAPIYRRAVEQGLAQLAGWPVALDPAIFAAPGAARDAAISAGPAALAAQALGLRGGWLALDAACASSLYALKLACNQLQLGKADLMLASAVSAADALFIHMGFSIFQAFPEAGGASRPLDRNSRGLTSGEGAGALLLKRYSDAVRDGDKIYAVIQGIGWSNDGAGKHVLVPNPKGQLLAYERAYAEAGLAPSDTAYIECHATGTPVGDIAELQTIEQFFGQHGHLPMLGSVKSNFGHMLTAAGMAGVMKVALSMAHNQIPPTIGIETPLASPSGAVGPQQIVRSAQPWPSSHPNQAAVSAFGFGGTNAHLVLGRGPHPPYPLSHNVGEGAGGEGRPGNTQNLPALSPSPTTWERGPGGEGHQGHPPLAIIGMGACFGPWQSLNDVEQALVAGEQAFGPLPTTRWKGCEQDSDLLRAYGVAEGQAPVGGYIERFTIDSLRYKIPPAAGDQPIPQQLLILKVADEALRDAAMKPGANVAVLVAMEAELAVHQFRARVDTVWQLPAALERAGIHLQPNELAQLEDAIKATLNDPAQVNQYTSFIGNLMACRIAALWDFTGPAFTIAAEECGVFRALEVAQELLATGSVEAVVVGAVDLAGGVERVLTRSLVSPVGSGVGHDELASGWLVGEGAGAIVLRRHEPNAETEQRIYATIDSLALLTRQRGEQADQVVARAAQCALQAAGVKPAHVGALELWASGVAAEDAAEMAGLAQVYGANAAGQKVAPTCAVGSVKANVGHAQAAAGIASLIRAALSIHGRIQLGVPGWHAPREAALWATTPFYVPHDARPWMAPRGARRRAAVSALGSGGVVAHAVLGEAGRWPSPPHPLSRHAGEGAGGEGRPTPAQNPSAFPPSPTTWERGPGGEGHPTPAQNPSALTPSPTTWERGPGGEGRPVPPLDLRAHQQLPALIPLAANELTALQGLLDDLEAAVQAGQPLAAVQRDAISAWNEARGARHTLALVANTPNDLLRELGMARKALPGVVATGRSWETPGGSAFTARPLGQRGEVALVYPGAFTSYAGLGRTLLPAFPGLHEVLERAASRPDAAIGAHRLYLRQQTRPSEADLERQKLRLRGDTTSLMAAGVGFATLFTTLLREGFGLRPGCALGYSMGESTMQWALGVWRDGDEVMRRLATSPVFTQRLVGQRTAARDYLGLGAEGDDDFWHVYVVRAPAERVRERLRDERQVFLTHVNTPNEVVLAGLATALPPVLADLGGESFRAPFGAVMHCPPVEADVADLVTFHHMPVADVPPLRLYTAAHYGPGEVNSDAIAHNIARAVCQPVDFPRLVERAYADGARIFLELGPGNSCTRWISECFAGREHLALAIARRGADERMTLVQLLARLVAHQVPLDLHALLRPNAAQAPSGRSLMRPIVVGGPGITASIVSDAHRQMVAAGRGAPPDPLPVPVPLVAPHPLPAPPVEILESREQESVAAKERIATQENDAAISPSPTTWERGPEGEGHPSLPKSQPAAPQTTILPTHTPPEEVPALVEDLPAPTNHAELLAARERTMRQLLGSVESLLTTSPSPATRERGPGGEGHHPAPTSPTVATSPSPATWERGPGGEGHLSLAVSPTATSPSPATRERGPGGEGHHPVPAQNPNVIWDEAALLEFACGSIAKVFGPEYAVIDSYLRRVRLPMPPYLLVSRVTKLDAERDAYRPCSITTEYDIPRDAWYCVDGQAPWAVSVESGQCDLLLISYLGIDFQCKSERVYRLLDCTLTFLDDLPKAGETLRYDIKINSFARNGDTLLFFFSYECFVEERMVLKMDGGCAGFFSDGELAGGRGVIDNDRDLKERRAAIVQPFNAPLHTPRTTLSYEDLLRLSAGDVAGCFGPAYDQRGLNPSLRLPPPAMLMIDRVTSMDPQGGAWGLGLIVAEKELRPDHWYFPCHFKDDEVLAGSLMAEGCGQLLQCYMLALGMQSHTMDARFQPIFGLPQQVRCRGQVTPANSLMVYRMEITGIELEPVPLARAIVDILVDDRIVVRFNDLGLQLREKEPALQPPAQRAVRPALTESVLCNEQQISEFATGSLVACFGPDYAIYDGRRAPRTPNSELQLISRIVSVDGVRGTPRSGASLISEYDVPVNPWFCHQNSYPETPYSILMELGLQPCGFLSAWLGSTLPFAEHDLYFRNLDGTGQLLRPVDLRGKTLRNRVTMRSSTAIDGVIIQKFDYALECDGEPCFVGDAAFGYFTKAALAKQVGLDGGRETQPWLSEAQGQPVTTLELSDPAQPLYRAAAGRIHERLPVGHFHLLDRVKIVAGGGKQGQGYIYGERVVDPNDWFFRCHFHQDPVMPGSLGLEAMLRALQAYALHGGFGREFATPHLAVAHGPRCVWKYRGQIASPTVPTTMRLELHITRVERTSEGLLIVAEGSLWRDSLRIYHVKDLALAVVG
ncbi:MAG: PfaB family protein [Candidatus Viridilinea halotolerans]|uniref:PfaB family protein n=1 Tax=Candidatus Viridilinea halotolerans TaxID=2491704 RepID=A0A426U211_9CHLR|nr:MAG: PfaB family protein [Candidatus Viridilinea halotolerans]